MKNSVFLAITLVCLGSIDCASAQPATSQRWPHSAGLILPSPEKLLAEYAELADAHAAIRTNGRTKLRFFALEQTQATNGQALLNCNVNSPKCDWADVRAPGPVFGPVRDQDQGKTTCGSCYVFGSGGAAEATWVIARYSSGHLPQPIEVSEEQLTTCEGGCDGGDPFAVLGFLKIRGVDAASTTPGPDYYSAQVYPGGCKINPNAPYRIADYNTVSSLPRSSIADIKRAIVAYGPVIVTLEATGKPDPTDPTHKRGTGLVYWNVTQAMKNSGDDVYSEATINDPRKVPPDYDPKNPAVVVGTTTGNHAVIITGWDDTKVDKKNHNALGAWHIRNSWGADWGDRGYAWISNVSDPRRYFNSTTNNIGYAAWYVVGASPNARGLIADMIAVEKSSYSKLSARQRALLHIQLK